MLLILLFISICMRFDAISHQYGEDEQGPHVKLNLRRILQEKIAPLDRNTVYGQIRQSVESRSDLRTRKQVKGKCFEGYGLQNCKPMNLRNERNGKKDTGKISDANIYYRTLEDRVDQKYCLQCCGTNYEDRYFNDMTDSKHWSAWGKKNRDPDIRRHHVDVWDMDCDVLPDQLDQFNNIAMAYGMEFRLGTFHDGIAYEADDDTVICPIVRSACQPYKRTGVDSDVYDRTCISKMDELVTGRTYPVAWEMHVDVVERYSLLTQWMEITSCEVVKVWESQYTVNATVDDGFQFREKIVMYHKEQFYIDLIFIGAMLLLAIPVTYMGLYFYRKQHCEVCHKKLIWSKQKCMVCKFFNADPPDPLLKEAIENKSVVMTGIDPPVMKSLHYLAPNVKPPPKLIHKLPTPEELHFDATKDSVLKEIQDKAAKEAKAPPHEMEMPLDPGKEAEGKVREVRKASKGERLFHATPTELEDQVMMMKKLVKDKWKGLPVEERIVFEDKAEALAREAHRLDMLEHMQKKQRGDDDEEKKEGMGEDEGFSVKKPKGKPKPKIVFNHDGTIRPQPKWFMPGWHWFDGLFGEEKLKRRNPNVLKVHPSVVYEAVEHPAPPPRPAGMIPREEDEQYGKPKPTEFKNSGLYKKKVKKRAVRQMTHAEWIAAGKPEWDEEKAQKEAELAELEAERIKKGLSKPAGGAVSGLMGSLGGFFGGSKVPAGNT